MSSMIHIELDALCLLLLCTIVTQSRRNVDQQMSRILFRTLSYGIIGQLILDILWLAVEGRSFPGAAAANRVLNALYLGMGVCLGCVWYLYVLETLDYRLSRRRQNMLMVPGVFFMSLNLISIWTGWVFTVSPDNVYAHGPLYWLQSIGAYGVLLISFVHLILFLLCHWKDRVLRREIYKLLIFYVVTVIGSLVSLLQVGMPGTWTCGAISVILIYLDDQNHEVLRGMITAMAADYKSIYYADLDTDECICVRDTGRMPDQMWAGKTFSFRQGFADYAEHCVAPADREAFLRFTEPENIRRGLEREIMISHTYLSVVNGMEQYELLRIAGVSSDDPEGRPIHAIGAGFSNVDRQTREEMEHRRTLTQALAKAEEANAAKTAFLSSMSHEIRTPMNAIIGLDNIALRDPNLSPATRDGLEKIGSSAHHLLSLINDILDMSRIESGRMELKKEAFSFRETVRQINTIINGQCEDKRLTYESRVVGHPDDYFVGDDLRLRQVIINILGNAVRFTDAPGTVTFTVEQLDPAGDTRLLRFTIADTGVGIDPAFLPKLFEPFSQEDASTTNRYGGSGLGMAITKSMVDLMGGSIRVESRKGSGTVFTVEIPLGQARHVETSRTQGGEEPGMDIAGLHVLIAEDQEMNAEILSELLEMEDVTSQWAENGERAVELFAASEAGHFDAILMDMRMPVMDGLTATREIRKLPRPDAQRIPILALTANAFEEDVQQCLAAGMDAHLSKPVDIDLLKAALAERIGSAAE